MALTTKWILACAGWFLVGVLWGILIGSHL